MRLTFSLSWAAWCGWPAHDIRIAEAGFYLDELCGDPVMHGDTPN